MKQQGRKKSRMTKNRTQSVRRSTEKTKWTISGISPETRAVVAEAAKESGHTIGDWVDGTLYAAAKSSLKGSVPPLALPPELLAAMDEIVSQLDRLNRDIEKDPQTLQSISAELRVRMEKLRAHIDKLPRRVNETFDRMQTTTKSMVDSLVEQADAAVSQSKEAAGKTIERVIDVGDATRASIRKLLNDESDSSSKKRTS